MEMVALGSADEDALLSLAGRLARLGKTISPADDGRIQSLSGGRSLSDLSGTILDALDPDVGATLVVAPDGLSPIAQALLPLASNPALRSSILEIQSRSEQTLDTVSRDVVLEAGFSPADTEKGVHW